MDYYFGAGAPIANAAAAGRLDIVQLLLDHGADPNLREDQYAPKGRALYSAVHHGHLEIAKLLLERGAFPNPPVESSGGRTLGVAGMASRQAHGAAPAVSGAQAGARNVRRTTGPRPHITGCASRRSIKRREMGDVKRAKKLLDEGADLTADDHLR